MDCHSRVSAHCMGRVREKEESSKCMGRGRRQAMHKAMADAPRSAKSEGGRTQRKLEGGDIQSITSRTDTSVQHFDFFGGCGAAISLPLNERREAGFQSRARREAAAPFLPPPPPQLTARGVRAGHGGRQQRPSCPPPMDSKGGESRASRKVEGSPLRSHPLSTCCAARTAGLNATHGHQHHTWRAVQLISVPASLLPPFLTSHPPPRG
eukprot:364189-Chlamydomonas_euryale.AAC.37